MNKLICLLYVGLLILIPQSCKFRLSPESSTDNISEQINLLQKSLSEYREELSQLRTECGSNADLPDVRFFLFGMGNRQKILYKDGSLVTLPEGELIRKWEIEGDVIIPPDYSVILNLTNGETVLIREDEDCVGILENKQTEIIPGTSVSIRLPDFEDYKYGNIIKVLHHEILINIINSKPVPNFLVYKNPWRRDGAMMAMCLSATGNINLIKDWALSLGDAYDRNNAGETEADNLGQTLYILSFFTDSNYVLVNKIVNEAKKFEVIGLQGKYIRGRSDFHETPVYQTKWMKFGLKSLKMKDDYKIPDVPDDYSALFWWDYQDSYNPSVNDADDKVNYPYLGWACDHFHKTMTSPLSNRNYPLTWESNAGQADYTGMAIIDKVYSESRNSSPHTWHASEMFLYLLEFKKH